MLAWTQSNGTVQRVVVAALSPTAVAGPTPVAQGALTAPPPTQGRASARKGQVLRIRADRTVRSVVVRVTRAARRAAHRRSLNGVITVTRRVQGAESVAFTDVVGVTVRRTRR